MWGLVPNVRKVEKMKINGAEEALAELQGKVRRWKTAHEELLTMTLSDYCVDDYYACKKELESSTLVLFAAVEP